MTVLFTGSRHLTDPRLVQRAVDASGFAPSFVVHGNAPGFDTLVDDWAKARGLPVLAFHVPKTEWKRLGGSAGPIRNTQMVEWCRRYPGEVACIAMPKRGAVNKGTRDCFRKATEAGFRMFWMYDC